MALPSSPASHVTEDTSVAGFETPNASVSYLHCADLKGSSPLPHAALLLQTDDISETKVSFHEPSKEEDISEATSYHVPSASDVGYEEAAAARQALRSRGMASHVTNLVNAMKAHSSASTPGAASHASEATTKSVPDARPHGAP